MPNPAKDLSDDEMAFCADLYAQGAGWRRIRAALLERREIHRLAGKARKEASISHETLRKRCQSWDASKFPPRVSETASRQSSGSAFDAPSTERQTPDPEGHDHVAERSEESGRRRIGGSSTGDKGSRSNEPDAEGRS